MHEEPYEQNSYPKNRSFESNRGDLVRSKSEKFIADKLYAAGIPYRYEEVITLENGYFASPDFTVLNKRTKEIYYIEHLGNLQDEQYLDENVRKLSRYYKSGSNFAGHLLITIENSRAEFDGSVMDPLIESLFR